MSTPHPSSDAEGSESPDAELAGLSYPRLSARTMRFTLGTPRNFTVSPDGARVIFLRAMSGTERTTQLWAYDLDPGAQPTTESGTESGAERLIVEPRTLLAAGDEELSVEERARRERLREGAAGVVGYSTDRDVRLAAFALSSRVWLADLIAGDVRELPSATPVIDPTLSPDGRFVAYASNGQLRVVGTASGSAPSGGEGSTDRAEAGGDRALVSPESETQVWGLAEFIAAEEMDRARGHWWAPDSAGLLVEAYDESPVRTWHIADPANPDVEPRAVRYPAAGTDNADVSLWYVPLDPAQDRREITWDHAEFPYLVTVSWSSRGSALAYVLTRDQRRGQVLAIDPDTGSTKVLQELSDPVWLNIHPGVPAWLPDGRLVTIVEDGQTTKLAYDGVPVTPEGVQVSGVVSVGKDGVLISATMEPTELHLGMVGLDGTTSLVSSGHGVHRGRRGGDVTVISSYAPDQPGARITVRRGDTEVGEIASRAVRPPFEPRFELLRLGSRELRAAVLFPRDHVRGSRRLPLLLDPYGGPHAQRVLAGSPWFLASQWLADQGFCVLVLDGRGTPNRGHAWERSIANDFVSTLDDQVEGVQELARRYPEDIDTTKVAMRGWSYGGYISALAVLRRPDVFHAAVAGAPVTEWRLYDTCYTERYLGHPDDQPEVYDRNGLLGMASTPATPDHPNRPLLVIHGLADDNVVVAHSLRLSSAMLAAGRPHRLLPLSGVTHMASQEVVAENLLLLELDFLRRSLDL